MSQQQQPLSAPQYYQSYAGAPQMIYSSVPAGATTTGAVSSSSAPIYRSAQPNTIISSTVAPATTTTVLSSAPAPSAIPYATSFPANGVVYQQPGAPIPFNGASIPYNGAPIYSSNNLYQGGQIPYNTNSVAPFDIRAYYGQGRRTEKYGEILYSAEIFDDREEDAPAPAPEAAAPAPAPTPAPAPVSVAAAPTPSVVPIVNVARGEAKTWRMEVEVLKGWGLPQTSGGLLKKDTSDPFTIVKINNTQAFTPSINNGGTSPVWNYKMLFGGNGPTCPATEGFLEVYDRDGEMSQKPPKSGDELLGKGSFTVREGNQEVQLFDAKNKVCGTVEIRIYPTTN